MQAQHVHCQTQQLHRAHKSLLQTLTQQHHQPQACSKLPVRCKVCGRKTRSARLKARAAAETAVAETPQQTTDFQTGFPNSKAWELDFSSRPVFDERGKKRWELLLCSPDGSWKFAQYFPNNKITSGQLKTVLSEILAQPGAVTPSRVRFFRVQMQTIITRALAELEMKAVSSRRCFTLLSWLQERNESVYQQDPTYKATSAAAFALEPSSPDNLPDALRGEQWSFVQLPLGMLQEELQMVTQKKVFGDSIHLPNVGLDDLPPDTPVPGVAVYTRRAGPMSAWTAGFELANLYPDTERSCLILETGVNRRFRYGAYRRSAETDSEAQSWTEAKTAARGLHFLVIQSDPDAEDTSGLWLLLDRELPQI